MNRLTLLAAISLSLGLGRRGGDGEQTQPNVLLIVADDMGYTDVGFLGGETATPNLDELAFGGARFTNSHAGSSCSPTRAMPMSGVTNRAVSCGQGLTP